MSENMDLATIKRHYRLELFIYILTSRSLQVYAKNTVNTSKNK